MDTQDELWVVIAVAAEKLGKSERTIRRWVADGKIPVDRTRRPILVDIAGRMSVHVTPMPDAQALQAEIVELRGDVAELKAERDRLWTALDRAQAAIQAEQDNARALVEALAGGQLLLTAGERSPEQAGEAVEDGQLREQAEEPVEDERPRRSWWRFWERGER